MGTSTATISVAAAAVVGPAGSRGGRGPATVRCSSSASVERQALFSRIAPVYDHLNDVLSLGQHRTWKRICVSWSRAKRGDRVLGLCCGSGDLAFLLSQKVGLDGEVMAVDFSRQQLHTAAERQEQRWKLCYKNIKWIEGDALQLPFTGCYFDAVTVGYGLRNVVDKPKAMQEIFRVLKPGSTASVLDFNKSSSLFTASLQSWMIDNVVVPLASGGAPQDENAEISVSIPAIEDSLVSETPGDHFCESLCPFRTRECCRWPDTPCAQLGSQFVGLKENSVAFNRLSIQDSYFGPE